MRNHYYVLYQLIAAVSSNWH